MVTVDTSTVGTVSEYATLELWETGEVADLVAGDIIARAEMKDEVHTATFILNGVWTTDAARYIWIDAPSGSRHDGTAGTGPRIIDGAGAHVISSTVAHHIHITWLELSTSAPATDQAGIILTVSGATLHADKCIIHGFTSENGRGFWFPDVGGSLTFINGVVYNIERAGFDLDTRTNTATAVFLNNTFHNVGTGPGFASDTPILVNENADDLDLLMKNNLCHSPNNSLEIRVAPKSTAWNTDTNTNIFDDRQGTSEEVPGIFLEDVTFQAGTGGSGTRVMLTNITLGAEDFHLIRDNDNAAIAFGENLTTLAATMPSNIHLDVDIEGDTRSTFSPWDVGAFNLIFRGAISIISASRRRMMTMQSEEVGPADLIEVTGLPSDFPHNFLSAQFFDAAGDQIVPTAGTILLEIETVSGSPNFELMVDGVVDATNPATLTWAANTHSLRATPTGLVAGGVTSWRIVATFNRT